MLASRIPVSDTASSEPRISRAIATDSRSTRVRTSSGAPWSRTSDIFSPPSRR